MTDVEIVVEPKWKNVAVGMGGAGRLSKSFKEILTGASSGSGEVLAPRLEGMSFGEMNGVPALFISDEEMLVLAKPFELTLIGKFAYSRPPVTLIRRFIAKLKFGGNVRVDQFDKFNVVFRFSLEDDYNRFFVRRFYKVYGVDMCVVKWDPFSDIADEVPVVPVWISLPKLRYQLFHKKSLWEISKNFGKPLCVDSSTAAQGFMYNARILVEVDASKELPSKIWLGSKERGYFQNVIIENMPPYCKYCNSCDHASSDCSKDIVEKVAASQDDPHIPLVIGSSLSPKSLGGDCEEGEIREEVVGNGLVLMENGGGLNEGLGGEAGDGGCAGEVAVDEGVRSIVIKDNGSGRVEDFEVGSPSLKEDLPLGCSEVSDVGKIVGDLEKGSSLPERKITRLMIRNSGESSVFKGGGDVLSEWQLAGKKGKQKPSKGTKQVVLDALFDPPIFNE